MCWRFRSIGLALVALGFGALMTVVFPAWLIVWLLIVVIVFLGGMLLCN